MGQRYFVVVVGTALLSEDLVLSCGDGVNRTLHTASTSVASWVGVINSAMFGPIHEAEPPLGVAGAFAFKNALAIVFESSGAATPTVTFTGHAPVVAVEVGAQQTDATFDWKAAAIGATVGVVLAKR